MSYAYLFKYIIIGDTGKLELLGVIIKINIYQVANNSFILKLDLFDQGLPSGTKMLQS